MTNTTQILIDLLYKKYKIGDTNEYLAFDELRNATGFTNKTRYIDVYLVGTWNRSKDIAIEIKASRSDFLSELKKPEKRKFAMDISNEFYFVTAPDVVKHIDEIPEGCGWMVATKNLKRLIVKKHAKHTQPTEKLPEYFYSICRRVHQEKLKYENDHIYQLKGNDITEDDINLIVDDKLKERIADLKKNFIREVKQEVSQELRLFSKKFGDIFRKDHDIDLIFDFSSAIKIENEDKITTQRDFWIKRMSDKLVYDIKNTHTPELDGNKLRSIHNHIDAIKKELELLGGCDKK